MNIPEPTVDDLCEVVDSLIQKEEQGTKRHRVLSELADAIARPGPELDSCEIHRLASYGREMSGWQDEALFDLLGLLFNRDLYQYALNYESRPFMRRAAGELLRAMALFVARRHVYETALCDLTDQSEAIIDFDRAAAKLRARRAAERQPSL